MQQTNYFGIPYKDSSNYFYNNGVPVLPHIANFKGYTFQQMYSHYCIHFLPMGEYETALKEYIVYYIHAPLFDIPKILKMKFRFRFDELTPAEMILDLMDYINPFEL